MYTSIPTSLPLPNVSSCLDANSRTTAFRQQALNQLTIPKEQIIHTDQTDHATIISDSVYTSPRFLQNLKLLDCCMTLEDCFGPEDEYGSGGAVEYCGELPLPPSVHARMAREEKFGVAVKPNQQESIKSQAQPKMVTEDPGSSPMELHGTGELWYAQCHTNEKISFCMPQFNCGVM